MSLSFERVYSDQWKRLRGIQLLLVASYYVQRHMVRYDAVRKLGSWIEGWVENSHLCRAYASYLTDKVAEGQVELWSSPHETYCITPVRNLTSLHEPLMTNELLQRRGPIIDEVKN